MSHNQQTYSEIRLASRPEPGNAVSTSNFKLVKNIEVKKLPSTSFDKDTTTTLLQVRPLYFSVDPYLRCQFDAQTGVDYVKPYSVDGPISSMCVGVVEKIITSGNKNDNDDDENATKNKTSLQTLADPSFDENFSLQVAEGSLVISENPAGWPWRDLLFFSDTKTIAEETTSTQSNNQNIFLPLKDVRSLANLPITKELASHMLGVFHVTGLTAYFGILKESGLVQPDPEEPTQQQEVQFKCIRKKQKVVLISSAAGGTGVIACQLVKKKCNLTSPPPLVIGVTGSDEKAKKLLAFGICDKVINYKKIKSKKTAVEDLREMIREASNNDKIDMYFDSVGGDLSKAVHHEMSENGRIVLCGQIATYDSASKNPNQEYPPPLSDEEKHILFDKLHVKRERYLVLKYASEFEEAAMNLLQWVTVEKSILPIETVYKPEGFEHLGEAFVNMMAGGNFGKMVVKV